MDWSIGFLKRWAVVMFMGMVLLGSGALVVGVFVWLCKVFVPWVVIGAVLFFGITALFALCGYDPQVGSEDVECKEKRERDW